MTSERSVLTLEIAIIVIAAILASGCAQHERNQVGVPPPVRATPVAARGAAVAPPVSAKIGWITHDYYSGPPPRHPSALQPG